MKNKINILSNNHAILYTPEGTFLQSYSSIIAKKDNNGKITLDGYYWDYSKTTGKHRNEFLGEDKKETQKKIDAGIYKLAELN